MVQADGDGNAEDNDGKPDPDFHKGQFHPGHPERAADDHHPDERERHQPPADCSDLSRRRRRAQAAGDVSRRWRGDHPISKIAGFVAQAGEVPSADWS
jgi:hypothetical protein